MSNPCNLAISPSQDTSRTRKIELPAFSSCVSLMTSRGSWRHDLRPKTILDRHGREIKLKTSIIWLFRAGFVVGYQILIYFQSWISCLAPEDLDLPTWALKHSKSAADQMFRPAAAILGRDHRDRSSFCSTRAVTADDLFVLCCFFRKPPSIDYNIPTLGGTFGDLDSLVIQVESSRISSTTKNFANARADVGSRDSLLIGVLGAKNSCKKEQNTYI